MIMFIDYRVLYIPPPEMPSGDGSTLYIYIVSLSASNIHPANHNETLGIAINHRTQRWFVKGHSS